MQAVVNPERGYARPGPLMETLMKLPLQRTPIASHALPGVAVDHIPVVRLDFKPGEATGRHTHPMPVLGYVLEGAFVIKVEGRPEQRVTAGQSVLEPARVVIEQFDNASKTEPAVLIAHYLAGSGDAELIHLLPTE